MQKTPCSDNPALWYGNDNTNTGPGTAPRKLSDLRKAAFICQTKCPFIVECAQSALQNEERYGVWAGEIMPGSLKLLSTQGLAEAHQRLTVIAAR